MMEGVMVRPQLSHRPTGMASSPTELAPTPAKMTAQTAASRRDTMSATPTTTTTSMKSQSYGTELLHSLNGLKANDQLCDFTVSADGKYIQVHKILLAATSDYFRAMLLGPMKESLEAKVDLKGLSSIALEQIIDFIYTGEMNLNLDNLIDILNAGSHLQISPALDLCSDFMISMLNFNNADDILGIADTYSLSRVTQFYNKKVLDSFEEFAATNHFLEMPMEKLEPFMQSDELKVRNELIVYEAISKWYGHDTAGREKCIEKLVTHVRFALLSESQLLSAGQHWFSQRFPKHMAYIQTGLQYHRVAEVGYPLQIPGLNNKQAGVRASSPSLVVVYQGSSYRPFELCSYNAQDKQFYQLVADITGSRDCRMVSLENFVYLCRLVDCGGGTLMNSLLRFDPRHLTLTELVPCRRLRIDTALVAHGGCLYVFGGTSENPATSWLDSVERYDPKTNSWHDDGAMPMPTHSHNGVSLGAFVYVAGGVSPPDRTASTVLHRFDPATHTWSARERMHCARRLHEMVAVPSSTADGATTGRLFVLGGIGGHNVHQQSQIPIEVYDVSSNQWTILSTTLAGRSVGHFLVYDGSILSIGREHQHATEDEIWQYDMEKDSWKHFTKMRREKNGPPNAAAATLLHINYSNEKLLRRAISDSKR